MLMMQVVLRRGGRADRSREVHMPVSESVAAAIAAKAEHEARERDKLKRLILQVGNQLQHCSCVTDRARRMCDAACMLCNVLQTAHACIRSLLG